MNHFIDTMTPGSEYTFIKQMQEKYGIKEEEEYIPKNSLFSKIVILFKKTFNIK